MTIFPKKTESQTQAARVMRAMLEKPWQTIAEITRAVGGQPNSVAASMRQLRKREHGGWQLRKRVRKETAIGALWEYKLSRRPGEAERDGN